MYKTMPYFNIYGSDFKSFRGKISNREMLEVLDKIVDISLFGFSDIELKNEFQQLYFEKLITTYEKNLRNYRSKIENGKKGGRPKKEEVPPQVEQEEPAEDFPISPPPRAYDITCNPRITKYFQLYKELCTDLKPIRYENRNREILELVAKLIDETQYDIEYFKDVCIKANELKVLCENALDFKSVIKNHIAISNEKFKKGTTGSAISKLKFK